MADQGALLATEITLPSGERTTEKKYSLKKPVMTNDSGKPDLSNIGQKGGSITYPKQPTVLGLGELNGWRKAPLRRRICVPSIKSTMENAFTVERKF